MPPQVTQRGNRGQPTFFGEEDHAADVELLAQWCQQRGVEVWAYCRMPNPGHWVAGPQLVNRLRLAMGEGHRRDRRRVNFRHGWRGHWWPGRFACFVMDGPDLLAAARDVELDPVRAGLVAAPSRYRWSSGWNKSSAVFCVGRNRARRGAAKR
jgi:putative transposase